jgi:phosphatidate cytidylyltransferase
LKRLISAVFILPPLLVIVRFGSPVHFLLLLTLVVVIALLEFYRMLAAKGVPCRKWLGVGIGIFLPLTFYMGGMASHVAIAAAIMLSFITGLFERQELAMALQSLAFTLLGVFYVGWLLSHVILLRLLTEGIYYVFYVFGVVWLGDAVAMGTGTLLGRSKLAPTISPLKTIEGAIGGLIGSICGAVLGGMWLLDDVTLLQCIAMGVILAVLGQLGDLSESFLKRSVGIKDSSAIIPGHGGMLDKVDGILFGAPALYYYVLYVVRPGLSS